ncbi:dihydrodipicolinate synthase family protein [Actinoplanes sp. NPDC023801]|uniref:dihydrodipicolinate synthase family protein n=1 Tax=Actinoplanes sp. NPDC023801 TaxID=3154595 RepID=UPI0033C4099C
MSLDGIFVPLITPFGADGGVAADVLERLANDVLSDGAAGLVALGTTGEPSSLTAAEQETVVGVIARVSQERGTPLLVGTRMDLAAGPDVTAALALVPPFVRPGEDGVVAHIAELAGRTPVVVYHVPYRTGQDLSVAAIRRLAGLAGVVGMKYSTGAVDAGTVELLADLPDGFALLGGDDPVIWPLLALGAHGGILASAHLETRSFAALAEAWRAGDVERGRHLGGRLAAVSRALFAAPNPTVIKAALYEQGRIPTPSVRLPLLPARRELAVPAIA